MRGSWTGGALPAGWALLHQDHLPAMISCSHTAQRMLGSGTSGGRPAGWWLLWLKQAPATNGRGYAACRLCVGRNLATCLLARVFLSMDLTRCDQL